MQLLVALLFPLTLASLAFLRSVHLGLWSGFTLVFMCCTFLDLVLFWFVNLVQ